MNTSEGGREAIERREGFRPTMYLDSAGLPTIGVGHLLTKDELSSGKLYLPSGPADWHTGLTLDQIDELLAEDVELAEATVNHTVAVPLTAAQFDTLVSFAFNVGTGAFARSTLLKVLNQGSYDQVPAQLRRWIYAAGQVSPGLVKRRRDEAQQWEGQ